MTRVEVKHWLHLEDNNMGLTNSATSPPVTTGLITSDPEEPACWEWQFGPSDDVQITPGLDHIRATAATATGFQIRMKVSGIDEFDEFEMTIRTETSIGGNSFLGVALTTTGGVNIGYMSSFNGTLVVVASLPSGTIQDCVWHTWSFHGIHDNTSGEAELSIDGGAPATFSGDTVNAGAVPSTGWGLYWAMSTTFSGVADANVRIAHVTLTEGETGPIVPQAYEWLIPDATTADADAVIAGSTPAATRHESVDETPVDAAVTLLEMPVGKQGFTFANRTGTGTQRMAQLWGNLADPAAGAPTVNSFLSDGTETDSPTLSIPSSFFPRALGPIIETAPSGGALDVDVLTGGLERSA